MQTDRDRKINQLNQDFYKKVSNDFDDSRKYSWEGFLKLIEKLAEKDGSKFNPEKVKKPIKVLDLGCGNARFYSFLKDQSLLIYYVGIDYTQSLLESAVERAGETLQSDLNDPHFIVSPGIKPRGRVPDLKQVSQPDAGTRVFSTNKKSVFRVYNSDIFKGDWVTILKDEQFDLVVMLGVMHHIPSVEIRNNIFKLVRTVLISSGFFVTTTWQFLDNHKLVKKVVDLDSENGKNLLKKYDLSKNDFGSCDYILDWQRGVEGFRFCHHYNQNEISEIATTAGFQIVDSFKADGQNNQTNCYWILKSEVN